MKLTPRVQEERRVLCVLAKSWGFTDAQAKRLAFWAWLADRRRESDLRQCPAVSPAAALSRSSAVGAGRRATG